MCLPNLFFEGSTRGCSPTAMNWAYGHTPLQVLLTQITHLTRNPERETPLPLTPFSSLLTIFPPLTISDRPRIIPRKTYTGRGGSFDGLPHPPVIKEAVMSLILSLSFLKLLKNKAFSMLAFPIMMIFSFIIVLAVASMAVAQTFGISPSYFKDKLVEIGKKCENINPRRIDPEIPEISEGKWMHFDGEGRQYISGECRNGNAEGVWVIWHDHGNKAVEASFREGEPEGVWKYWNYKGMKVRQEEYKDGLRYFKFNMWNKRNGNNLLSGGFKNDTRHEKWIYWNKDGSKQKEGTWNSGRKDGKWTFWSKDGSIEKEEVWKNGKRVSRKSGSGE